MHIEAYLVTYHFSSKSKEQYPYLKLYKDTIILTDRHENAFDALKEYAKNHNISFITMTSYMHPDSAIGQVRFKSNPDSDPFLITVTKYQSEML